MFHSEGADERPADSDYLPSLWLSMICRRRRRQSTAEAVEDVPFFQLSMLICCNGGGQQRREGGGEDAEKKKIRNNFIKQLWHPRGRRRGRRAVVPPACFHVNQSSNTSRHPHIVNIKYSPKQLPPAPLRTAARGWGESDDKSSGGDMSSDGGDTSSDGNGRRRRRRR